jgi:peptidoglycan/xylan/chitin deacetylase (PgdA/CDA1 family)
MSGGLDSALQVEGNADAMSEATMKSETFSCQPAGKLNSTGIILMYHRVADVACDPWSLCVSPLHFAEHLEVLKQMAVPLRLGQLYDRSDVAGHPFPWVAITFDDGYADNLYQASRILKRFEVPATFFLVSGCLVSKAGFWWDELEHMLLRPGTLPPLLDLDINGRIFNVGWRAENSYTIEDYQRDRNWRVEDKDPSPRHTLFRILHGALILQPETQRQEILNKLRQWSRETPVASLSQVLSAQEAVTLAREELFEIGAHTMTHCSLASLPTAEQKEEIIRGKDFLEKLLGRAITCFSYPYGAYTQETISLVREAGFASAVTVEETLVQSSTGRFQLPRVAVHDWDADEFKARIFRLLNS